MRAVPAGCEPVGGVLNRRAAHPRQHLDVELATDHRGHRERILGLGPETRHPAPDRAAHTLGNRQWIEEHAGPQPPLGP